MPAELEAAIGEDPWTRDCSDDAYHMIAEEAHRSEREGDVARIE